MNNSTDNQPDPDSRPDSPPPAYGGLSDLSGVTLDAAHEGIFNAVSGGCRGSAIWRRRKLVEFREVLALSQISGRMVIQLADLTGSMRILFELRVPVPTMPDPAGDLVVADRALLGLTYPEEAIREPLPGPAFVTLLQPNHLFLANAAPADPEFSVYGPGQAICLGTEVAAGTPVKELVLQVFGALTLQSAQLDQHDAAGIMNPTAAAWWLRNRDRMPLTRQGFLEFQHPATA